MAYSHGRRSWLLLIDMIKVRDYVTLFLSWRNTHNKYSSRRPHKITNLTTLGMDYATPLLIF
jgi:hypothetical protein